MKIIPAIDLKDGKCVRLYKGDFDKVTEYSADPLGIAAGYGALDVRDLHIVDLDGARTGSQFNRETVSKICARSPPTKQKRWSPPWIAMVRCCPRPPVLSTAMALC